MSRKILEAAKHMGTFAEVEGVVTDNNAAKRAWINCVLGVMFHPKAIDLK